MGVTDKNHVRWVPYHHSMTCPQVYQTTQCHISQDSTLHNHRCGNLRSDMFYIISINNNFSVRQHAASWQKQ
jgi:hypothetical protein